MKMKTMIRRALEANKIPANMTPEDGLAILYLGENNEVYALKVDMAEDRLKEICRHVAAQPPGKVLASKLV